MKPLTKAIEDYLALRRSLGFKLHSAGAALMNFASFMERQQAQSITTRLALDWAQQPVDAQPAHWAQRLSFVRGFARLRATSPRSRSQHRSSAAGLVAVSTCTCPSLLLFE